MCPAVISLLTCFEYFSFRSLNSDGEEMSTADNFNDIYYSLKYEADLLFTRFVSFLMLYQTMHVAEAIEVILEAMDLKVQMTAAK